MQRCVVTGHHNGHAVFVSDGDPAEVVVMEKTPGMTLTKLWATPAAPGVGNAEAHRFDLDAPFLPTPGESRMCILSFPPDALMKSPGFDIGAAMAEFAAKQPEMAALREKGDPAMHRTDTVDHILILDGEVWLELDDQEEVLLRPQDVVIQNGTRHAWRNRSDKPVTMAVFMVGAERRN